jgi:hypothetical protein
MRRPGRFGGPGSILSHPLGWDERRMSLPPSGMVEARSSCSISWSAVTKLSEKLGVFDAPSRGPAT